MNSAGWQQLLLQGLAELNLDGRTGVTSLIAYGQELERWGEKLGLVHASGNDLVVRHLLDSLAGLKCVSSLVGGIVSPTLADIGSGGGLPGAPLACFLPQSTVHLVERSGRKCGFLRAAVLAAKIRNVVVRNEDFGRIRDRFTVVTLRAFRPLSEELMLELAPMIAPGGAVCAYKGRVERTRIELSSLSTATAAGFEIEMVPLSVPFLDEERHLVVMRKRAA